MTGLRTREFTLVAAVCAILAGCGERPPLLPEAFGGLTRTGMLSTSEARIAVNQLHGKDVSPAESGVASYARPEGTATLYVSRYGSEKEAEEAMEAMAGGLRKGAHPLGAYHELRVGGRAVTACLGTSQAHYTFVEADRLYWLAADSGIALGALQALMDSLRVRSMQPGSARP